MEMENQFYLSIDSNQLKKFVLFFFILDSSLINALEYVLHALQIKDFTLIRGSQQNDKLLNVKFECL